MGLRLWPDERTTVEVVLPRRTALRRAVASGRSEAQLLAANVDATVLVVVSLTVEPDLGRIERLVALAWESGAQPVVVLTKADLVLDAHLVEADVAQVAPGAPVHVVSAVSGAGMAALRPYVSPGRTLVLIGPSGVGKSTLANMLIGADILGVGATRPDGKGRHVTAARDLVPLPSGGVSSTHPACAGSASLTSRGTRADVSRDRSTVGRLPVRRLHACGRAGMCRPGRRRRGNTAGPPPGELAQAAARGAPHGAAHGCPAACCRASQVEGHLAFHPECGHQPTMRNPA